MLVTLCETLVAQDVVGDYAPAANWVAVLRHTL